MNLYAVHIALLVLGVALLYMHFAATVCFHKIFSFSRIGLAYLLAQYVSKAPFLIVARDSILVVSSNMCHSCASD